MNDLKQKGMTLDQADVMIAANSIKQRQDNSHKKKHFERINNLKIDIW